MDDVARLVSGTGLLQVGAEVDIDGTREARPRTKGVSGTASALGRTHRARSETGSVRDLSLGHPQVAPPFSQRPAQSAGQLVSASVGGHLTMSPSRDG